MSSPCGSPSGISRSRRRRRSAEHNETAQTLGRRPSTQPFIPAAISLARELGIDTGEIERHRAFYIIDRTLPVGFQRGQDLNTEKAILVNRFIE